MSKYLDDAKAQREDIAAWFRSLPGVIVSGLLLTGLVVWFVVTLVIDTIAQATG